MSVITDSIAKNCTGWDEAGGNYGDIQLYNATLVINTSKFKAGDKVPCITFLFSQSLCQLYDENADKVEEFTIKLVAE